MKRALENTQMKELAEDCMGPIFSQAVMAYYNYCCQKIDEPLSQLQEPIDLGHGLQIQITGDHGAPIMTLRDITADPIKEEWMICQPPVSMSEWVASILKKWESKVSLESVVKAYIANRNNVVREGIDTDYLNDYRATFKTLNGKQEIQIEFLAPATELFDDGKLKIYFYDFPVLSRRNTRIVQGNPRSVKMQELVAIYTDYRPAITKETSPFDSSKFLKR